MQAKFILPFLFSFIASIIAVYSSLRFKDKSVRRLGGIVVILVFILMVLLDKNLVITKPITGIILGSLLVLFFGLWDDLKNINWKWQLVAQIIIAIAAISLGVRSEYITNPLGGIIDLKNPLIYFFLFSIYYLIFLNSLNWLDGIDGLSGSVTLVALATIFLLSRKPEVNQPAVAILSAIAGGAILGFLIFNWHPAKILAGTSGAWFFGFILASLSIFAGAKIATVLMATLIPVLDLANVVWERHRAGQSIFSGGDNRHLHHKLLKLGLDERLIVVLVCLVSAGIGFTALKVSAVGKLLFLIIFSLIYFVTMRLVNIKCKNQKP